MFCLLWCYTSICFRFIANFNEMLKYPGGLFQVTVDLRQFFGCQIANFGHQKCPPFSSLQRCMMATSKAQFSTLSHFTVLLYFLGFKTCEKPSIFCPRWSQKGSGSIPDLTSQSTLHTCF